MRIHVPEGVPAVVSEAIEAANAHDTDRFLDAFAVSGAVDDWGRVFTGRDEIRGWSDREFIGLNGRLTIHWITQPPPVLIVTIGTDGGYNGPSTLTFTLSPDGGGIDRMAMAD